MKIILTLQVKIKKYDMSKHNVFNLKVIVKVN